MKMDPLALLILLVYGFLLAALFAVAVVVWFCRKDDAPEPHGRTYEELKAKAEAARRHWRDN